GAGGRCGTATSAAVESDQGAVEMHTGCIEDNAAGPGLEMNGGSRLDYQPLPGLVMQCLAGLVVQVLTGFDMPGGSHVERVLPADFGSTLAGDRFVLAAGDGLDMVALDVASFMAVDAGTTVADDMELQVARTVQGNAFLPGLVLKHELMSVVAGQTLGAKQAAAGVFRQG